MPAGLVHQKYQPFSYSLKSLFPNSLDLQWDGTSIGGLSEPRIYLDGAIKLVSSNNCVVLNNTNEFPMKQLTSKSSLTKSPDRSPIDDISLRCCKPGVKMQG